jgi:hypothetical protein
VAPSRYLYTQVFEARLALSLTTPTERRQWLRSGLPEEIGLLLLDHWDNLSPVPGRDARWRRLVVGAELPFSTPGVLLIDARASRDGQVAEIRAIAHVNLEP